MTVLSVTLITNRLLRNFPVGRTYQIFLHLFANLALALRGFNACIPASGERHVTARMLFGSPPC